jgi:hypothetical protein
MTYLAQKLFARALDIQQTLGTRSAAGFLRKRAVPFEDALYMLTGRKS